MINGASSNLEAGAEVIAQPSRQPTALLCIYQTYKELAHKRETLCPSSHP
jgi:hypothetical protein